MPELPWSAIVAAAALAVSVALAALTNRMRGEFADRRRLFDEADRPIFVDRDEAKSAIERVHRRVDEQDKRADSVVGLVTGMDDRIGVVENRIERLDERQAQHWERISEQLSTTAKMNDETSRRLEAMGERLSTLAIRIEQIQRDKP